MEPIFYPNIFFIIEEIFKIKKIHFLDEKLIKLKNIFFWKIFHEVSSIYAKYFFISAESLFIKKNNKYEISLDKNIFSRNKKLIIIFLEENEVIKDLFLRNDENIFSLLPTYVEFWVVNELNPYKQNLIKELGDVKMNEFKTNALIFSYDFGTLILYFMNFINYFLEKNIYKNVVFYVDKLEEINVFKSKFEKTKTKIIIEKINSGKIKKMLKYDFDLYIPNFSLNDLYLYSNERNSDYYSKIKFLDTVLTEINDIHHKCSMNFFINNYDNLKINYIDIFIEGGIKTPLRLETADFSIEKFINEGIQKI